MKKSYIFVAGLCLVISNLAYAGGETKEVCEMVKDKKGKEVKVCKQVKVHKKLEGTEVPKNDKKK